jgi:hypothetical protein
MMESFEDWNDRDGHHHKTTTARGNLKRCGDGDDGSKAKLFLHDNLELLFATKEDNRSFEATKKFANETLNKTDNEEVDDEEDDDGDDDKDKSSVELQP